ncbi:MAG: hypothetical protein O2923_04055 [Verrucomicrobia bacterium]|nr:hypothetical protein [Verrucomicrobiota bacterium]MDA1086350.1 hypothetical protein [Verrucomicrobiota bacterium]
MARALHLVYLLAVYSLLTPARAEPDPGPLRWSWWGQLEMMSYDEPGVMQEEGVLYGLAAAVEKDVEAGAWSPSEWKTGFRLEFDWLIRGHNDSRTDLGFVDASVTQDSGYGLQLSFTILREFAGAGRHGQPLRLTLEPFV